LCSLLEVLVVRSVSSTNKTFKDTLSTLREQIDRIDDDIMQKMAKRMKISEKIGQYKKENNVTILQVSRWEEVVHTRVALGKAMGLDEGFTRDLLRLMHHESIQVQTKVMNEKEVEV
jgi:chorismate mutase